MHSDILLKLILSYLKRRWGWKILTQSRSLFIQLLIHHFEQHLSLWSNVFHIAIYRFYKNICYGHKVIHDVVLFTTVHQESG